MSGFQGLAIPGPTNMPFEVRKAMDVPLEDHRAPDFGDLTLPLLSDLKKVFKTTAGEVLVFPGAGTLGWEAAITNTLSPGDKVLTAVFGQFSHLWADMCQRFGLDVDAVDTPWGQGVPLEKFHERLAADKNHEIQAVFVCHNETATGVTSDVPGVRKILDDLNHPALLMVDGVSSIGSIDFRMDEWFVDIAVSGSQKGFMLPAGLAIVGVSQKALARRKNSRFPTCFADFGDMLEANATGYFPYTPATTLLRGLRASLDMIEAEGLENVFTRHQRLANGVRKAVSAWGLKLCAEEEKWHSDTVSAILVPDDIDANEVIKTAYYRYGLSLGGGLSKVAGKVFRIGHLGHLNESMLLGTIATCEMAMRDAGVDIEAGCGVGAAEEHYRATAKTADLAKAA